MLFVTRDGLYSFNGTSVDRVARDYDKYFQKLDNANCCCACHKGKYYLATRHNFDDGEQLGCEAKEFVNNILFEIDVDDFEVIEKCPAADLNKQEKYWIEFYQSNSYGYNMNAGGSRS